MSDDWQPCVRINMGPYFERERAMTTPTPRELALEQQLAAMEERANSLEVERDALIKAQRSALRTLRLIHMEATDAMEGAGMPEFEHYARWSGLTYRYAQAAIEPDRKPGGGE